MKKELRTSALTTVIVISGVYAKAQQPATVPPPPPVQSQSRPPLPGPDKGPAAPLKQLVTLNGHVTGYLTNDRLEYDRFIVHTSDKVITVLFPAHLAEQLMEAAPKGTSVMITGTSDETPDGPVFRFYRLKTGNKEVEDTPPVVPEAPPSEKIKNFSGTVSEIARGRNGDMRGVILNNNVMVMLPPPAIDQLSALLKDGLPLSGTGVLKTKPLGVVMARSLQVTEARTLSINGQTYLVR